MSDQPHGGHPDIETLMGFSTGALPGRDADAVRSHVEACARCRIELKRLQRFEAIDADAALLEESGWDRAEHKLERAFRERVLPGVLAREAAAGEAPRPRSLWARWQVRWLVPAAAAAAVLLVVTQLDHAPEDAGPMRGQTGEAVAIVLQEPVGDVAEAPARFRWRSDAEHDYYTIALFTANLDKLYEASGIEATQWTPTDSLESLLKRDTIYIWNVSGHKGVEREAVSPNGWFSITK